MTERDWNRDWWDATSPDVLTKRPASFDFEMYLQQRKVLQYWLKRVRELEALIATLKDALEFYAYTKPVCACIVDGVYTKNYKDYGEIAREALAALDKREGENDAY